MMGRGEVIQLLRDILGVMERAKELPSEVGPELIERLKAQEEQ